MGVSDWCGNKSCSCSGNASCSTRDAPGDSSKLVCWVESACSQGYWGGNIIVSDISRAKTYSKDSNTVRKSPTCGSPGYDSDAKAYNQCSDFTSYGQICSGNNLVRTITRTPNCYLCGERIFCGSPTTTTGSVLSTCQHGCYDSGSNNARCRTCSGNPDCPDGKVCLGTGFCFSTCSGDSECSSGYRCYPFSAGNVCLTKCSSNNGCQSGYRCVNKSCIRVGI